MLESSRSISALVAALFLAFPGCATDEDDSPAETEDTSADVGEDDASALDVADADPDSAADVEPEPDPDLPPEGTPFPECEPRDWDFENGRENDATFTDVTAAIGIPETYGSSVAWGDLNGDLRPDLVMLWTTDNSDVASRIRAEAYLNCPGGFVPLGLTGRIDSDVLNDRGTSMSISDTGATSVTIADVDGDGRADLVTGLRTAAYLSFQEEDGSFTALRVWEAALGARPGVGVTGVLVSDFDRDGLVDLYVSILHGRDELLMNAGARVFENRTDDFPALAEVALSETYAAAHIFSPIERDRSFLYITAHASPHGDAVFEVLPGPEFVRAHAVTAPRSSMGIDYIHTSRESTAVAVTDTGPVAAYSLRNGRLEPPLQPAVSWETDYNQWGIRFGDFDNDGWADMVFAAGVPDADPEFAETWGGSTSENPVVLLPGAPVGTMIQLEWTEQVGVGGPALDGTETGNYFSVVTADFDYDGCLDLAVSPLVRRSNRPPSEFWDVPIRVLRNDCGTDHQWIGVQIADDPGAIMLLRAKEEGGEDREFIREVQAAAGNGNSNFTQQLHVGLGSRDQLHSVEFHCRDGRLIELMPHELQIGTWNMRPDICAPQ